MKAVAFLCILFLSTVWAEDADYKNLCSLFRKDTKLREPAACDRYITCSGRHAQVFDCPNTTNYDAKQQKCVADSDATELCLNRCFNAKDGTYAAHPTNCRAFFYCKNKQATESYCSVEHHFDQDRQMCVYPRNSQCIQQINNICELVADKTVFRDEKDCSKYYKCDKNKLTRGDCKQLYFNVETGKCVEKSTVSCWAHHPTADTCLKNKKPFVGHKSDGATCRGYFICANKGAHAHDLQPVWYHCQAGEFFNEPTQQCLPAIDVKCNYNRCEGRGNATVVSGKNNCRNYLQCENDVVLTESTCEYHYFFDERLGACGPSIVYDRACDDAKTHS